MSAVSFDVTRVESALLRAIVARAELMAAQQGQPRMSADERRACLMDVTATVANGCPMDLERWLNTDDFNFAHDFNGIAKHLDRTTGKLLDCFVPRFALPQRSTTWAKKRKELQSR